MLAGKTVTVSARSEVTVTTSEGEKVVTAMTLNGNLNAGGGFSITRYIRDPEAYRANKEQMAADADEFENIMLSASDNK